MKAKSAESWKPQDLNPRQALSQLSCRELALREQLFNIFSFLDLNFHYMQTHSSFFMALKKRLVEKSLFHSSPGIYPAFALFATMLACFVTAFLYWTPYICIVFALDRSHSAPCCTLLNILLHSGMSLLCLRPVGNGKYWNLNKEIKFQLGVDLRFYSKLCLIPHNIHTLWYY